MKQPSIVPINNTVYDKFFCWNLSSKGHNVTVDEILFKDLVPERIFCEKVIQISTYFYLIQIQPIDYRII
jgi:hypothetical protein